MTGPVTVKSQIILIGPKVCVMTATEIQSGSSSQDGLMEFTLTDKEFHHIDALNAIENLEGFLGMGRN